MAPYDNLNLVSLVYSPLLFMLPSKIIGKQQPWKAKAAAKVASTHSKIPQEWLLSHRDVERAKHQRQLSGPFIEQFLNDGELAIIRADSMALVEDLRSGKYSALQVTRAFCKTAAVAHQIVSRNFCTLPATSACLGLCLFANSRFARITVFMRFSSTKHYSGHTSWMSILASIKHP